jgi:hypothetical protein
MLILRLPNVWPIIFKDGRCRNDNFILVREMNVVDSKADPCNPGRADCWVRQRFVLRRQSGDSCSGRSDRPRDGFDLRCDSHLRRLVRYEQADRYDERYNRTAKHKGRASSWSPADQSKQITPRHHKAQEKNKRV